MLRAVLLALAVALPAVSAFSVPPVLSSPAHSSLSLRSSRLACAATMGKRPLHTSGEFTVEKATPELMADLEVKKWPTWSTAGSEKYKVGVRSPLKVYDSNELSYIISGKMEIESKKTGEKVLVQAGDFVTFPDEFACYWHVIEEVTKHWYLY